MLQCKHNDLKQKDSIYFLNRFLLQAAYISDLDLHLEKIFLMETFPSSSKSNMEVFTKSLQARWARSDAQDSSVHRTSLLMEQNINSNLNVDALNPSKL